MMFGALNFFFSLSLSLSLSLYIYIYIYQHVIEFIAFVPVKKMVENRKMSCRWHVVKFEIALRQGIQFCLHGVEVPFFYCRFICALDHLDPYGHLASICLILWSHACLYMIMQSRVIPKS